MAKNKRKMTVACAISGGVDSSVAAALLVKQGHNVLGVFMHFWGEPVQGKIRENVCCSLEAQEKARRVCQKLGIPFYTFNFKIPFKQKIVDPFLDAYQNGRTPNPCVWCNPQIKFGEFLWRAKKLGADFIATGHYARTVLKVRTQNFASLPVRLMKSADAHKDQTYFLHQLTQAQLRHVLFPIGGYTKDKVRAMAREFNLPTATRPDSQEVCFVPEKKLREFLKRHLKLKPGRIVDVESGHVLGRHEGLALYTIGQRQGLGLGGGPWYVVKKGGQNSVLSVTRERKDLETKELRLKNFHWIAGKAPKLPLKAQGRIRYGSKASAATIDKKNGHYFVKFAQPQRAVTPGQFAVFWKGKECLGGGEIEK